jgi:hypothetical protein
MAESNGLQFQFGLTMFSALIAFGFGYLLSYIAEYLKMRRARVTALVAIINQLETTQIILQNHAKQGIALENVLSRMRQGKFAAGFLVLPTSAFESALYSGVFREFDKDTQLKLSSLYDAIKVVNLLETDFVSLMNVGTGTVIPTFIENAINFFKVYNHKEIELLKEIPEVISFLKSKK